MTTASYEKLTKEELLTELEFRGFGGYSQEHSIKSLIMALELDDEYGDENQNERFIKPIKVQIEE